jgi:outer membrane protein assembly factor BamB
MYGHDPQHTSYNPDETIISPANVGILAQAWQAPIGVGPLGYPAFSAPSVANGKVYIASSVSTGDNFLAWDAASGGPDWSAFIGYNPGECFGVGIGSTAAVSGTVVAIGGGDGAYYGLSTSDGSQLWRDPLNAGPSAFAWVSPLLANGHAYVGVASDCDNPSVRGEVRSLDFLTGAHTGNVSIVPEGEAGGGVWNSPALSPDGGKVIVTTGEDYDGYNGPYNRALMVLDANTLQIMAYNQQGTPNVDQDWATTPMVFHDRTGRLMVGAGHKNGRFYAYDLNNVNAGPVWSWRLGLDLGTPGAYDPTFGNGGTLFFTVSQEQRLHALDPIDGSDRWPSVFVGSAVGGIAAANGLVYINSSGTLRIVNETTGVLIRSITPPNHGPTNSGPVVSNGTVYWVSGAYLNAWRLPSSIPTPTAASSPTPTSSPTPEPPVCPSEYFKDVCPADFFYESVLALTSDGILSGYNTTPPCNNSLWIPCFKPYKSGTRGQIAKIASLAAGFNEPVIGQQFADVPPSFAFYTYTQRLAERGIVSGYPCGGSGEPCGPTNLPYFRPSNKVTRGQIAKIVARTFGWDEAVTGRQFEDVPPGFTFYDYIGRLYIRGIIAGYPCGGPAEPCGPTNLPYFRPNNDVTRGQTAKIIHNARLVGPPTPTATSTPTPTGTGTPTSIPTNQVTATSTTIATPSETLLSR